MAKKVKTETQKLRQFGLVMAGALGLFGSLAVWRGHEWGQYLWYLGGAFLLLGLVMPRVLGPIERVWMAFAAVLGVVMTTIILTLTFFVVMTPMGILLRAMGKDLLELERNPEVDSYWAPVDPEGSASRPDKPY